MSVQRIENVSNSEFEKLFKNEIKNGGKNKEISSFFYNSLKNINEPSNRKKINMILNKYVDVIKGLEEDGLPFTVVKFKHIPKNVFQKVKQLSESETLKL